MLICQQTSSIIINNEIDTNNNSNCITCSQLAAYINNNNNQAVLTIDCGSPLRHTDRRITDSLLINVNDKISRKRLTTRGLKGFLDLNQLNRFDKNEIIVLYDDTIHTTPNCTINSCKLSPAMTCIYEQIKRYDENKKVYILQSSFSDFYQLYPSLCYISTSTDEDFPMEEIEEPVKQSDIDFCQLSEVLPGLFLGSSRDAEDLNLLKQNGISIIINVSTTIPFCFESDKSLTYLRIPCHDSINQNILQYFESTFQYISDKLSENKKILVHCQGGVSRSPSFIIGYLMRFHSKTFEQAYNLTKTQRNIINPNLNFLGQLTKYQQMLTSV